MKKINFYENFFIYFFDYYIIINNIRVLVEEAGVAEVVVEPAR
jgi:hypothetical protein